MLKGVFSLVWIVTLIQIFSEVDLKLHKILRLMWISKPGIKLALAAKVRPDMPYLSATWANVYKYAKQRIIMLLLAPHWLLTVDLHSITPTYVVF